MEGGRNERKVSLLEMNLDVEPTNVSSVIGTSKKHEKGSARLAVNTYDADSFTSVTAILDLVVLDRIIISRLQVEADASR